MIARTASATIRTHEQISESDRRNRIALATAQGERGALPAGHARSGRRPNGEHARAWTNTLKDRYNGGNKFFGPGWLAPEGVPQTLATITASIIWGICGKMADMPEY